MTVTKTATCPRCGTVTWTNRLLCRACYLVGIGGQSWPQGVQAHLTDAGMNALMTIGQCLRRRPSGTLVVPLHIVAAAYAVDPTPSDVWSAAAHEALTEGHPAPRAVIYACLITASTTGGTTPRYFGASHILRVLHRGAALFPLLTPDDQMAVLKTQARGVL